MEQIRITLSHTAAEVQLHYDFNDETPGFTCAVPSWEAQELLGRAETDYYVRTPDDPARHSRLLRSFGRDLYEFLDTSRRHLSLYIEQTSGRWDVLVLGLMVSGRFAHLPWELLHDGTSFLAAADRPVLPVRLVPGSAPAREAQHRPLRLLFAVCAPDDVTEPLDFDHEEAQIRAAARTHQIELRVEERGTLAELREMLEPHPDDYFDVVHLSGHAIHTARGPRFLTETVFGSRSDASADDLAWAFANRRPALIFLSGCRTAENPDAGVVPSLAEELIGKTLTSAIIGWGRRIDDAISTMISAVLYRGLSQGLSVPGALAEAYRAMIGGAVSEWHLLRIWVRGTIPGVLVTPFPGEDRDSLPPEQPWPRIAGVLPVPEPGAFVGRRLERRQLLRLLDSRSGTDRCGVLIYGMGGLGKSTLVGRVLMGLGDAYRPVVIADKLTHEGLLSAIRADSDLAVVLDMPVDTPLRERLLDFLSRSPYLALFVLDRFEANFSPETHSPGRMGLTDDRAQVLTEPDNVLRDLIEAVRRSARKHRVVVTSRYVPDTDCVEELTPVRLSPMRREDIQKMVDRLRRQPPLADQVVERIRRLAGQNPRLLEWLFGVAWQDLVIDEATLDARLRDRRIVFLEKDIFADLLLDQLTPASMRLLQAAAPFRIHVPPEVLARLVGEDDTTVLRHASNLARLGLLEPDDARGVAGFRVPLVLEPRLRDEDPDKYRDTQASCAEALAAGLGNIVYAPDPRKLDQAWLQEVHRLATAGGVASLAVDTAAALAAIEAFYYRYEEAARICRNTLDRYTHHMLYAAVGSSEFAMGRTGSADLNVSLALRNCPADAHPDRAHILVIQAALTGIRNRAQAIAQLREAETLARQSGARGDVPLCDALTSLGELYTEADPPVNLPLAESLFDQANTVAERIADDRFRATIVQVGRAIYLDLARGDVDQAMERSEAAWRYFADKGLSLHQIIAMIGAISALNKKRDFQTATGVLHQCFPLAFSVAWAYGVAACLYLHGTIALSEDRKHDAEFLFRDALTRTRQVGQLNLEAEVLRQQVLLYQSLGKTDEASEAVRQQRELWNRAGTSPRDIQAMIEAAETALSTGNRDTGIQLARDAGRLAHADSSPRQEAEALKIVVAAQASARPFPAELEPALRTLVQLHRSLHDKHGEWAALLALGILLVETDQIAEAGQVLEQAETLGEVGQGADQGELYIRLAAVAKERRRAHVAADYLHRAALLYRDMAEPTELAVALAELAAVMPAAPSAIREEALRIALAYAQSAGSPREREVAASLADIEAANGHTDEAARLRRQADEAARRTDIIRIEIGNGLLPFADPREGGQLLYELRRIRSELSTEERGWTLPDVHISDSKEIGEREYQISVRSKVTMRSHAPADHAVLVSGFDAATAPADVTEEPGFLPQQVRWLAGRQASEVSGQSLLTPSEIIAGNLKHLAREHRSALEDDQPRRSPDALPDEELPSLETLKSLIAGARWKAARSRWPIRRRGRTPP